MKLLGLVLFAVMLLGVGSVIHAPPATAQTLTSKVPVGVVSYFWFGWDFKSGTWRAQNGTSHWSHEPATAMNIRPVSYYSSLDNMTVARQLSEMHYAGIDFLIASWWGPGDYTDAAIKNLFRYVNATGDSIKLAIMVEPYAGLTVSDAENYVYRTFYEPYSSHIFNWLGKPLLCFFLPTVPEDDPDFTIRTVGNGAADWQYVAGLPEYVEGTNKPSKDLALYTDGNHTATDGEVTVTARFDNYYEYRMGGRNDYLRLDLNYTGLFRTLWNYAQANAKLIVINSFNEMTEGSMLEEYISEKGVHVCPIDLLFYGSTCCYADEWHTWTSLVPFTMAFALILIKKRKVPELDRERTF